MLHTLFHVILALSRIANSPEGQVVITASAGVVYDFARRYCKTKVPASLLWDLHHVLKWVSEVTGNAASAMDTHLVQNVQTAEGEDSK